MSFALSGRFSSNFALALSGRFSCHLHLTVSGRLSLHLKGAVLLSLPSDLYGAVLLSLSPHNLIIAFRHLPPNSARFGYATEGVLFISAQLSTDAVSALRKILVLIRLWKQPNAQSLT